MIGNITTGYSWIGVLKYVFGKGHDCEFMISNLASSVADGLNKMAREFLINASQKPSVTKNVKHFQFSPNKEDNKTDAECIEYIQAWMKGMGYENVPYVIAAHMDTGHRHFHVVTTNITLDGDVVPDSNERLRQMKLSRKLEKEFGFTPTVYKRDMEGQEYEPADTPKWQRDKDFKPHDHIVEAIKCCAAAQPTIHDFIESLAFYGIDVDIKFNGDRINLSYKHGDYALSATKAGGSQKQLEKKFGVTYDPTRDRSELESFIAERAERSKSAEHQQPEHSVDADANNAQRAAHEARGHDQDEGRELSDARRLPDPEDTGIRAVSERSGEESRGAYQRFNKQLRSRLRSLTDSIRESSVSIFKSSNRVKVASAVSQTANRSISVVAHLGRALADITTVAKTTLRERRRIAFERNTGRDNIADMLSRIDERRKQWRQDDIAANRERFSRPTIELSDKEQEIRQHIIATTNLAPDDPNQHYQVLFDALPEKRRNSILSALQSFEFHYDRPLSIAETMYGSELKMIESEVSFKRNAAGRDWSYVRKFEEENPDMKFAVNEVGKTVLRLRDGSGDIGYAKSRDKSNDNDAPTYTP